MPACGTVILSNLRRLFVILVAVFVASVTYGYEGVLGRDSAAPTAAGPYAYRIVPLGDGFLALWAEGVKCSPELRGIRLDRDGHPIDARSFVVAPPTYSIFILAAVPDGDAVYVAWSGVYDPGGIHLTRVSADTVTLIADSIPTPTGSGSATVMSVSNGNILFVGWGGHLGEPLTATLLDRNGAVVRSRVTLVEQAGFMTGMDLVAVNGGAFLLAWMSSDSHLRSARITPADVLAAGERITPSDLGARTYMYNVRLASDGEHAMVFWMDANEDGSHYKLRARALSTSGTPLGAGTITIDFVTPSTNPLASVAVSDGYEVFFSEAQNYHPAFVGVSFDGTLRAVAHPRRLVTAAQNRGQTIAFWSEKLFSMSTYFADGAGYEALTAPLAPDGSIGAATIVSLDSPVQHVRKLVPFANGIVALWTEGVPNDRLVVTRLTASGQPVDGGLRLRESLFDQSHSAAATDGERLFIVWTEGDEGKPQTLYGAIVSPDALSASVKPLAVDANGASDIAVVWNGETFTIAYQRVKTGGFDFAALRADRSGNAVDPAPIALTPTRYYDENPRLSWNGSDYLLVWQRWASTGSVTGETCYPPQPPPPAELFAQRFSAAFAITGAEIPLAMTSPNDNVHLDAENVDVSFLGGFWLVVWFVKGGSAAGTVRFARIDASGVRYEPLNGRLVPGSYDEPILAPAPDGWIIAAHEGRRWGPGRGVALAHISVNGIVTENETVPIPGTSALEAFVLTPAPLVAFKRASSPVTFTGTLPRSRAVHR
jgi:hypothetical protein